MYLCELNKRYLENSKQSDFSVTRGEPIKIRDWEEKFGNCFVTDISERASGKMMHVHHLFQCKLRLEKKRLDKNTARTKS